MQNDATEVLIATLAPAACAQRHAHPAWDRYLQWSVLLLAAFNLLWFARRLLAIFLPWDAALVPVTTSGCEEEALFSLWRFAHGEAVYSDPTLLPYAISYFNWLFYLVYG